MDAFRRGLRDQGFLSPVLFEAASPAVRFWGNRNYLENRFEKPFLGNRFWDTVVGKPFLGSRFWKCWKSLVDSPQDFRIQNSRTVNESESDSERVRNCLWPVQYLLVITCLPVFSFMLCFNIKSLKSYEGGCFIFLRCDNYRTTSKTWERWV